MILPLVRVRLPKAISSCSEVPLELSKVKSAKAWTLAGITIPEEVPAIVIFEPPATSATNSFPVAKGSNWIGFFKVSLWRSSVKSPFVRYKYWFNTISPTRPAPFTRFTCKSFRMEIEAGIKNLVAFDPTGSINLITDKLFATKSPEVDVKFPVKLKVLPLKLKSPSVRVRLFNLLSERRVTPWWSLFTTTFVILSTLGNSNPVVSADSPV